jgi:hypothetical protein
MSHLSDYERERLEKIAKNKLFMASLGLDKKIIPPKKSKDTPTKPKPQYVASRSSQRLLNDKAQGKVVVYNDKKLKSEKKNKRKRIYDSDESEDSDEDGDDSEEDDDGRTEESSEYSALDDFNSDGDEVDTIDEYTSEDIEAGFQSDDEDDFKVVSKKNNNNKNNNNNRNNNNNNVNKINNNSNINSTNNNNNNKKRGRDIDEVTNDLRKSSRIATHQPISYKKMDKSSEYNNKNIPHVTKPPTVIPIHGNSSSSSSSADSSDESPRKKTNQQIKIMFSNIENSDDQIRHVVVLKAEVTKNIKFCTHLISSVPIKRTKKFFAALRFAKYIVTLDWLKDSVLAGEILDERKYLLQDKESEKLWKFNLQDTMKTGNSRGALSQCKFFVNPNILSAESMKGIIPIIKNAGGTVLTELRKPTKGLITGFHFIVTTKEESQSMIKQYKNYGHDFYFVDTEFIFLSILRQKMCMDELEHIYLEEPITL